MPGSPRGNLGRLDDGLEGVLDRLAAGIRLDPGAAQGAQDDYLGFARVRKGLLPVDVSRRDRLTRQFA